METNAINHYSTQQDMTIGFCASNCCALKSIWITLITSSCSIPLECVQLQSTIDDVLR